MCNCMKCNRELTKDEIGLFKKLVNRGAQKYMCLSCMSEYFDVSETALSKKIEQYKEIGCTLFL
ncbi:MAG: hypothetical protein SOZ34_02985 [Clostridia bacterium]|nr:hypothetical protein [Clostridia bacterium]